MTLRPDVAYISKWRVGTVLLALALAAWLLLNATESAGGATLDVCPSGCTYSSIQDALDAASPGDTIEVAAATYAETISITKDITIVGEGAGSTTIDGGGAGTVVTVTSDVTVTITDFQITNGSTDVRGGGVLNEGTLAVERVDVRLNTAVDRGGGIYNAATLTVIDSTIAENTSMVGGGGGIASAGPSASVSITRSSITDNVVVDPATDFNGGGGIYTNHGDLHVEDSVIANNESGFSAGGIFVGGSSAEFTMVRSVVSGNVTGTAPNRKGSGGGLALRTSSVSTITDSTISGNVSDSLGGGLQVLAKTTLINSTVSGNQAEGGGGIDADVNVTLSSVTVAANSAPFGGGIRIPDHFIISDNSLIADNTASEIGPDCMGNVFTDTGDVSFVENTDDCDLSGDGTFITGQDPLLGSLADNGGPTRTHLPEDGSPLIDAGVTDLSTDQRGEPRPSGAADDIGSVEVQQAESVTIEVLETIVVTDDPSVEPSVLIKVTEAITVTDDPLVQRILIEVTEAITVSDVPDVRIVIAIGELFTFHGDGFDPGSDIFIDLLSDPIEVGFVIADDEGGFEVEITLPADTPPGDHDLVASGVDPNGDPHQVVLPLRILEPECTIVGTPGDDILFGTPGPDVICGLDGNDILIGGGGDDILFGGPGDDELAGGPGRDALDGGTGDDTLSGGDGDDNLAGGPGDDKLSGGDGDDQLYGREGADQITGGNGDDWLFGGDGPDRLLGGDGNDVLIGGSGDDVLVGGDGDDVLIGGSGDDVLIDDSGSALPGTTPTTVPEEETTTVPETTTTTAEVLGTVVTSTTVEEEAQVSPSTLPFTGVESGDMALLAMALLGVGILVLVGAGSVRSRNDS